MTLGSDILKRSIESLVKLQEIDAKLFQLKHEKESVPPELAEIRTKLSETQKNLKGAERSSRDSERERRSLELRLLTLQEDTKRAEARKRDTRNTKEEFSANKDYDLAQKKLADLRSILEEKSGAATQRSQSKEEHQKSIQEIETKLKELESQREEKNSKLDVELNALESQRQSHISKVHEDIFPLYERVQRLRRGTGIALVKKNVCTGCYVAIPPQTRQKLEKFDEIITCPSCSRILYPENILGEGDVGHSATGS